ncbi:EI24 domain-containing protein [Nitratifractor sp.]
MSFTKIIGRALRDIASPSVLGFVLKVGLGSFLFWMAVLWLSWGPFERFVATYISMIPGVGKWEWLQESGAFLAALAIGYALIVVTISILTSLFSEKLILKLAAREYPQIRPVGSAAIHRSIYYTVKASIVFLLLFLLTLPLIFVPVFGQFWMLWLWSILLKEPTVYDVGSLFISDPKLLKQRAKKAGLIAMIAALFNYIPLLNIFAPLFAQILFLHYLLANGIPENRKS